MSNASQREIDQLLERVRELEREVRALREETSSEKRGFAEVALAASVEGGDTNPAAIGAVTSTEQTVASGQATILEIVNSAGTWKLKPIQNSSSASRAKVTYLNAANSAPQAWATAAEPMLLVRLRDGKWVRFPAGGAAATIDFDVITGFEIVGNLLKYRKKRIKINAAATDLGLTDLFDLQCS